MHDVEIIVIKKLYFSHFCKQKNLLKFIYLKRLKTKVKIIRFQNFALKIYRLMKDNAY